MQVSDKFSAPCRLGISCLDCRQEHVGYRAGRTPLRSSNGRNSRQQRSSKPPAPVVENLSPGKKTSLEPEQLGTSLRSSNFSRHSLLLDLAQQMGHPVPPRTSPVMESACENLRVVSAL